MMWVALGFLKRDVAINLSYRANFALQMLSILVAVIGIFFVSQLVDSSQVSLLESYDGNYFAFLILGLAFFDFLTVSIVGFAQSIREGQMMGTLEVMLLSPTRLPVILIGSSLWSYLFTFVRFLAYIVFGLAFGFSVGNANFLGALLIICASILAFAGFGMISASLILVLKRGDPLGVAFASLSALFGGVFYPTTVFPPWLERLSQFIPLTYSLAGIRKAMVSGAGPVELLPELTTLLLFALITVPAGLWLFGQAARRAKIVGTLTQY